MAAANSINSSVDPYNGCSGLPSPIGSVTADLEILEIEVATNAPIAGEQLADVRFPRGSLIIADADGAHVSDGDTVLDSGSRYLVAVESGVKSELLNLLRG